MKEGVDYVGVGVGAAIINQDRKLFLALRGQACRNERGKWETPGGKLEFGDTMEGTIVREMLEEYGFTVEVVDQLHAYDHIIKDERQHWVAVSYICRIKQGEPVIMETEKCAEIGWFTLDEADKLPLSLTGQRDIAGLRTRYPDGLPNLY